jgi:hypothetical protein
MVAVSIRDGDRLRPLPARRLRGPHYWSGADESRSKDCDGEHSAHDCSSIRICNHDGTTPEKTLRRARCVVVVPFLAAPIRVTDNKSIYVHAFRDSSLVSGPKYPEKNPEENPEENPSKRRTTAS